MIPLGLLTAPFFAFEAAPWSLDLKTLEKKGIAAKVSCELGAYGLSKSQEDMESEGCSHKHALMVNSKVLSALLL